MEGVPYGFATFLFGWYDTPYDNYPPLMSRGFFPVVFSILEDIMPRTIYLFMAQAINRRLGTDSLNLKELAAEAARRNTTIDEVMAIVEKEEWIYTNDDNSKSEAYVCSAFMAGVYKAAGIFGKIQINPKEFTPKDVYSLKIFNSEF